jgi:hypothetical protein
MKNLLPIYYLHPGICYRPASARNLSPQFVKGLIASRSNLSKIHRFPAGSYRPCRRQLGVREETPQGSYPGRPTVPRTAQSTNLLAKPWKPSTATSTESQDRPIFPVLDSLVSVC